MIPFPTVLDNPILIRELRRRMRGRALVYSMIGYICLITLIAVFIMLAKTPISTVDLQSSAASENFLTKLVECGQSIFKWITGIQTLLVLIIAPTITAGMTTGEKERKTFEFLQVTTIHPWAYILGSFFSTVFYVSLALVCALPPLCLAFLYGGVAPSDVVNSFLMLFAGSLVLSAFGLYISSVRDRTRAAQGIVVFVIFIAVFGGMSFVHSFSRFFGVGLAGGGAAAPGGMYVFGVGISPGILIAAVTLFLTTIFLLLATRKLYRSDERAFTYWQFGLLFLIAMGVLLGLAYNQSVGDQQVLAYSLVSAALLATAAVCFGVGHMEVGDEIWHLKRLVPILRPIDESLFFLGALAVVWVWLSHVWLKAPAITTASREFVHALTWVGVSSLVFFVFLGRLLTMIFFTRKMAGRVAMGAIGLFWVGLPLLGSLLAALASPLDPLQEAFERFSPIYLAVEYINTQGPGAGGAFSHLHGTATPGFPQAVVYMGLAVIAGVFGEVKRWRYTRRIDAHFEMPEG